MKLALLLIASGLIAAPTQASASHICWIERAVDMGDAVHVVMRKDSEWTARRLRRLDGTSVYEPAKENGSFDLKEGEVVYLSTFPHDSCTGTAVKRDGKLGLALKGANCMPGLSCIHSDQFVSDAKVGAP